MSVHNDAGDAIAIARAWLESDPALRARCAWEPDFAPAPVHRLDRETSGVLVIALSKNVARSLAEAFQSEDTTVRKTYRAIVRGRLQRDGRWNQPLTDRAEGRSNPAGKTMERKPCETRFRILRANEHVTELEIDLMTGRQHQIRKHAALAGHAVIGDTRYGDPSYHRMIEKRFGFSRMLLHAQRLELQGPVNICAVAPLPEEFAKIFIRE